MKVLTQARLKEVLEYNPDTGIFVCKTQSRNRDKGSVAGTSKSCAYIRISIDNQLYYAHRLAFLYMTGVIPPEIDHINGNGFNNKWSNLRECTRTENSQNQIVRSTNNSGYTGVCWYKRESKWRAYIVLNGKQKHLGYFESKEEAGKAYLKAKETMHSFNPVPRDHCDKTENSNISVVPQ